jgi:DNA-binding NarL/FixJ family response regulator
MLNPTSRPRVLLADDHDCNSDLLWRLLGAEFDVIGQVRDGVALVNAAEALAPDVIVTDISMPGMDGITAAARILDRDHGARIVFLTVHSEQAVVERGLATGALGYVLKITAGDNLLPAVRAALRGERHVSAPT